MKYLGDVALLYAATGVFWTPIRYLQNVPSLFVHGMSGSTVAWLGPALLLWMLPFVWLGVTLSMRRAIDAQRSPWFAVMFLVPYVNYLLIGVLLLAPSRTAPDGDWSGVTWPLNSVVARCVAGAAGVVVAVVRVAVGLNTLDAYGAWLFILTPFAVGASSGFIYNRGSNATATDTSALVMATLVAAGGALLVFGQEGMICMLMALPIALPLAVLGGSIGRKAARSNAGPLSPTAFMLIALPLTATLEPQTGATLHEVRSSVIVNAPPTEVWPHVVAFREIPRRTTGSSAPASPIRFTRASTAAASAPCATASSRLARSSNRLRGGNRGSGCRSMWWSHRQR